MFNAKKSPNTPKSLSEKKKYDSEDVVKQLFIDFNSKCYLCGDKVNKDHRIEHFIPHKNENEDLKYDWNNLFLSCDYCNNIKSASYNIDGKDIINPVSEKVEDFISHSYIVFPIAKIEIKENKSNDRTNNTIDLLTKIYLKNKYSSQSQKIKREQLLNNLIDELNNFRGHISELYKYYLSDKSSHDYKFYEKEILSHLDDKSKFIEFKRQYLRTNNDIKIGLEKILDKEIIL